MATTTLRLSLTRPIPLRILAAAMRIETMYVMNQLTPLLASIIEARKEVSDLVRRCEIIGERVECAQHKAIDLMSDMQPLIADFYNLCGDPECDGTCVVCSDGEYLGEEDYTEKYCKRGRR